MSWSDSHLNSVLMRGKHYGVYHAGGMVFSDKPKEILISDLDFDVNLSSHFRHAEKHRMKRGLRGAPV